MPVTTARIGLPYLDQCARYRAAISVGDPAMDDDPLADRIGTMGVVQDKVIIERL
jgi:hypothetical protein